MPSPARKFLLAGRGGLNLTHSEPLDRFLSHYDPRSAHLQSAIRAFPPDALRAWCESLGQRLFTGTSGRIFPTALKAAPLLRAWLHRLNQLGVVFAPRHRWLGFDSGAALRFATPDGERKVSPDATILALGGASWPRMGSDGGWVSILQAHGVTVHELRAANCGVHIAFSPIFTTRFEAAPLKRIAISIAGHSIRGEAIVTRDGLEGGAIYAHSAAIRRALDAHGEATLHIDLKPDMPAGVLAARVDGARQGRSLSNFLRQQASLPPVAIGLVHEALRAATKPASLGTLIKAIPLRVHDMQPIARAISSSGGVAWHELTPNFMLRKHPGLFAAGEMLDWQAPTGGYLLQACFSTALAAAKGAAAF